MERELKIKFGNSPPIALAGANQVVSSGATVTLDGSGSSDPDGDKLTYKWEQLGEPGTPGSPGTPGVTLSSTTVVKPTFTAPTSAGALSFKLTVTDSQKASHSDTVDVTVLERVVEALGTLDYGQYVTRRDDWSAAIPSVNRPGRYAKFYCFSLTGRSKVQIDLASSVDTFLCLLLGAKTDGRVLQLDDDGGGPSGHSRIIRTLEAGNYIIEATTYAAARTGSFEVGVEVYSNDATLKSLSLYPASVSLSPAFAAEKGAYTASVGNGVGNVRVTPTVNHARATVTVKGASATSGQASDLISLKVGVNSIVIVVTAKDGTTRKYAIVVTRAAAPSTRPSTPTTSRPVTPPVTPPEPPKKPITRPITHSYRDITPAVYSGCGPNRTRKQECVRLGHEDTNWRSASEPLRWGRWYNTEHERNKVVGPWRNLSAFTGCGPTRKMKQGQTITWENEQERQSHCGHMESRWQSASTIDTRWVAAPEPLRWGSWTDTGRTREHPVELIVEKEQRRTSSPCGRSQTRWVT